MGNNNVICEKKSLALACVACPLSAPAIAQSALHDILCSGVLNAEIVIVEAPALDFQEVLSGRADVFITSNIEEVTLLSKFSNLTEIEVTELRAPTSIATLLPQEYQI